MTKKQTLAWTVALAAGIVVSSNHALNAATKQEKIDEWGDANIAIRACETARAMEEGKYAEACSGFRALIGLDPQNEDFYLGLYDAGKKADNWKLATLGLEELLDRNPALKPKLAKELSECLIKQNRADEAKDIAALAGKDSDDNYVESHVKALCDKSLFEKEVIVEVKHEVPKRQEVKQEDVHGQHSKWGLTLHNAFNSESIVVAEYVDYDKEGEISFYRPPTAKYHIVEYLKGPPLNKSLPIRYEFHEKIDGEKPENWKFDESLMPEKGSKWIIFIPNCVPVEGAFDTYHGSYGRQAYNDENLDKVLKIIEDHRGQTR